MRKYVNKFIIIVILILLNIIFRINNSAPNYENTEIKKKFSFATQNKDLEIKKPKAFQFTKKANVDKKQSKDEIINNILMKNFSHKSVYEESSFDDSFILDYYDDEDIENSISDTIVLDASNENNYLDDWQVEDAFKYFEGDEKTVFFKKASNKILMKTKNDIFINSNFLRINFDGCKDAILNLSFKDEKVSLNLNIAADLKYFYIEDKYMGAKVDSIEFIKDNDSDFYLSIGEIFYE